MITNDASMPGLKRLQGVGLALGVIGLGSITYFIMSGTEGAWGSYLFGFMVWMSITLGCLALMLLQNVTRGSWGVALIRFWDSGASNLILMAVLIVPILLVGYKELYPWADPAIVADNKIVAHKAGAYFKDGWFAIRAAVYFFIWIFGWYWLSKRSRDEDASGDPKLANSRQSFAAPWIVLFIISANFAITDWAMSLEKEWFSTILGLLFVVGVSLSAMALGTFFLVCARDTEPFKGKLFKNQWKDLGNLLFAMTVLWAYMSFSQWLITYSGNLPEEIPYYLKRNEGGWQFIGGTLIFLHFMLPFFLLLSSRLKRTPTMLGAVALFIVLIRLVDIVWTVVPSLGRQTLTLTLADAAAFVGIGGLWLMVLAWRLRTTNLYPKYAELPKPAEAPSHA